MDDLSPPFRLKEFVVGITRDHCRSRGIELPFEARQNHKLRQTLLKLRFIEHELSAYLPADEHQAFADAITRVTDTIRGGR